MKILVVNKISKLFERYGSKHYGESCSQTIHALSCATHAQQNGASLHFIVAAFLHDIGHFIADEQQLIGMDEYGHYQHAEIGANWLAKHGFPASVYQPIRYHVLAKRYLATQSADNKLSIASEKTLSLQGGLLLLSEQESFEQNDYFHQALNLRKYDDLGKPSSSTTLTIAPWIPLIEQVLAEKTI